MKKKETVYNYLMDMLAIALNEQLLDNSNCYDFEDLISLMKRGFEKRNEENEKLKEILLEAGATTHKSKKLYDWYCENTESKE
jgi:hypothetical protein